MNAMDVDSTRGSAPTADIVMNGEYYVVIGGSTTPQRWNPVPVRSQGAFLSIPRLLGGS